MRAAQEYKQELTIARWLGVLPVTGNLADFNYLKGLSTVSRRLRYKPFCIFQAKITSKRQISKLIYLKFLMHN